MAKEHRILDAYIPRVCFSFMLFFVNQIYVVNSGMESQNLISSSRQCIQHPNNRILYFKVRDVSAYAFGEYIPLIILPFCFVTSILTDPKYFYPLLVPLQNVSALSADKPSLQAAPGSKPDLPIMHASPLQFTLYLIKHLFRDDRVVSIFDIVRKRLIYGVLLP